jgi:hypothetical protein
MDPEANTWKKKHVHRPALMIKLRSLSIPKELDASHLCHNILCVNVDHLILLPHSVNNNRQCCKSYGNCIGHGDFPSCMIKLRLTWNNTGIMICPIHPPTHAWMDGCVE